MFSIPLRVLRCATCVVAESGEFELPVWEDVRFKHGALLSVVCGSNHDARLECHCFVCNSPIRSPHTAFFVQPQGLLQYHFQKLWTKDIRLESLKLFKHQYFEQMQTFRNGKRSGQIDGKAQRRPGQR